MKCAENGGGIFEEEYVAIKSYDSHIKGFQDDSDPVIYGEREWGSDIKSILKYLTLRYRIKA